MKKTILAISFLTLSSSAFAADWSLLKYCENESGTYYANVNVSQVQVDANWNNSGPTVVIKIGDKWFAKEFSDNAEKGFYQFAYMAYFTQARVNFCGLADRIRGIEFK